MLMPSVLDLPEVLDAPLDPETLAERWRELASARLLSDFAGKVELNEWGEIILMTPVGPRHGITAARRVRVLEDALGGRAMVEVGIMTPAGIRAPDVLWASDRFLAAHPGDEMPLSAAPELCIEIASPRDSRPKLREKVPAYIAAGAHAVWLVFPRSRRVEVYDERGPIAESRFQVEHAPFLA